MSPADLPTMPRRTRLSSSRGGGAAGLLSAVRSRSLRPDGAAPWLTDHPWRREGALDESAREVRAALVAGGLLTVAASVLGSVFLGEVTGGMVVVPALVVSAVLLAGLFLLGRGVLVLLRRARHGMAELRWSRLPFYLGEPLEVVLVREGATVRLEGLTARLTCIEERWEDAPGTGSDQVGGGARRRPRRVERWSQVKAIPAAGAARVPVRFDLPPPGPEAPGTVLSSTLPRYWELELRADLPGLDFEAVFLVPVYQRPGAAGLQAAGAVQ
jgi:hypothetical protein